jgi:superfamily I DNA and/or RNA helicase
VFDGISDSKFESEIVINLISDLALNGVKLSEIGIVTPYRAQVRTIRRALKNRFHKLTKEHFNALFIDTVDSIQGQERNYIIYSMANSHPLESMKRLDFFYSTNRLNVAITRAIKKCFVLANYKVFDINEEKLSSHTEYQAIKECLDIFKKYFSQSTKIEINQTEESEW